MTLRALVLGYGFIADMHIRAARSLGHDVEIVGVSGHHLGRASAFAARWGVHRVATDWLTMIAEPDIDLVIVGTPNALHHPQTMHALRLARHVLVEKPMAVTTAHAREMIDQATQSDAVLAVGHMWRYHPDVIAARNRIAAGEYGRIVRSHGWGVHAKWGPSGWFTDPDLAGGGALIDMGIHAIDTARFLIGDPLPHRVQASIGVGVYSDAAVDDDALVTIDWDNGVRSLVEASWWAPKLNGLEADTEIFGTAGAGRIWDDRLPPPDGYVHCDVPMYAAQLRDVIDAINQRRQPVCSSEVGLVALGIVEAAYAGARRPTSEPDSTTEPHWGSDS